MENYALELIVKGKRVDGRSFTDFRNIEIKENVVAKAEGSAQVSFGETQVIAGVKMNVGTPFPDTPDEGILVVNAEFTPLASPEFESGPPSEDAVELARIVDRGIRESKAIELDKLLIVSGEKVWSTFVDIHIINDQGNLLDCSALASIIALSNTKIPKYEDEKILRGEYQKELPLVFKPINISVGKVLGNYILDPNYEEEQTLEARLSVAVRDDNKICALQKQGRKELTFNDIESMVDLAIEKSKELRKLVKNGDKKSKQKK